MKKAELKKLLKPMIKECIKEVIFEEGILSNIVSEVAQGLGRPTLIDLFEGTEPLSSAGSATHNSQAQGPLSGIDPTDAGVDISGIMGIAGNRWSAHMK